MKRILQIRRCLPLLALAASLQLTPGYYDPAAQRWINRDPIGEPGFRLHQGTWPSEGAGLNAFEFVDNRPVTHVDPLGLASQIPGKVCFFPCPVGFATYCWAVCGSAGKLPTPVCYWYRLAGHLYIVADCGCRQVRP